MTAPDEYLKFARAAFEHRECRAKAEQELGGDVTAAPHPTSAYHQFESVICPHGVRYWLVPAEQLKKEHPE